MHILVAMAIGGWIGWLLSVWVQDLRYEREMREYFAKELKARGQTIG